MLNFLKEFNLSPEKNVENVSFEELKKNAETHFGSTTFNPIEAMSIESPYTWSQYIIEKRDKVLVLIDSISKWFPYLNIEFLEQLSFVEKHLRNIEIYNLQLSISTVTFDALMAHRGSKDLIGLYSVSLYAQNSFKNHSEKTFQYKRGK
jgi:hypothetical protein